MSTDGGFLPISDSMARDLDNGKADHRTLDDFLPDTVLQEMKDAQGPKGVVHAEDLVPISKADAARRTMFDGEHLPSAPATRRVIPAPYRRDRVTGGKHGKRWQEVAASQVLKCDIIPDVGVVAEVSDATRYEGEGALGPVAVGVDVTVTGVAGRKMTFDAGDSVRVFR
jgi:hypothetical protein